MRPISPSRSVAFQILEEVSAGRYASDSLREKTAALDSRDSGLASQIVFGCLRFQAQLDWLIFLCAGKRASELDLPVRIALRTAIFQLRYLERIPAHAAVHDSVEFVKTKKRAAAGLVNAVLRKVNRAPVSWPDEATALSVPEWLLRRWRAHFGSEQATSIARAMLTEPLPYIRVAAGAAMPRGVQTEATGIPGAYRLLSPLQPGMRLQDISSQAILPLLDLLHGHSYLDLCAAPGNKTLQALETPLRLAVACDISEKRIRDIPPLCPRVALDAAAPLPFNIKFDRIFIDAPCSGTGTLARNPEIKWRLTEPELGRFRDKQMAILNRALEVLAPGGKILYATCSLEPEENEQVVSRVLEQNEPLTQQSEMWRLPGRDEGDGFYAALLSHTR
ncbi:MAG: hypothetical protein JO319_20105 [Acidobacteriaceae bacterium]|nr:hypothetical protein [Acidobacteriaceae bacterium]